MVSSESSELSTIRELYKEIEPAPGARLKTAQDDDGEIVNRWAAAGKFVYGFGYAVEDFLRAKMLYGGDGLQEALAAEELVFEIHGFGDAVRVEDHHIAIAQHDLLFFQRDRLQHAQWKSMAT